MRSGQNSACLACPPSLAVLLLVAAVPSQTGAGQGDLETTPVREPGYEGMVYHFFTPKGVRPGKLYPLVFALHGNGASAEAHARNIAKVSTADLPVFVVAPKYQKARKFNAPVYPGAGAIFGMILRTILEDRPIDRGRVVLEGFSMGSNYSTAWVNALAHGPKKDPRFPFCAVWLNSTAIPPRSPAPKVPYLLFVGDKETAVLGRINVVENVRRAYKTMFIQNLDVRYVEIPNMGHAVNRECHRIMREHIAAMPDHTGAVPPSLAKVFPSIRQSCEHGEFAAALSALNDVIGAGSEAETLDRRSKARSLRSKISGHVRKFANAAARNRHPTIGDFRELGRLEASLADNKDDKANKALHDTVKSALDRMVKNKRFAPELKAWKEFTAAQKVAEKDWNQSLAAIKSIAAGPVGDTSYGHRAQAHMKAVGNE